MAARVAEQVVRTRFLGPKLRLRVDLHGVSVFGPGDQRTLIRWERIQDIRAGHGVAVRSETAEITLPPGASGLEPQDLAGRLAAPCSPESRPEVIAQLGGARTRR